MSTLKSRSDVHKSDSCKLVLRDDVMGMIHNITHFVKVLGGVKKAMEQCTAQCKMLLFYARTIRDLDNT